MQEVLDAELEKSHKFFSLSEDAHHNGLPLPLVHDPQVSAAMHQLANGEGECVGTLPEQLPANPESLIGFYAEDVRHNDVKFSLVVSSWFARKTDIPSLAVQTGHRSTKPTRPLRAHQGGHLRGVAWDAAAGC